MYTAYLTHPAGQFKGTGNNDHEAVMMAYNALKGAWSIDPWKASVTVYNGDSLAYVCKSYTAYKMSTN